MDILCRGSVTAVVTTVCLNFIYWRGFWLSAEVDKIRKSYCDSLAWLAYSPNSSNNQITKLHSQPNFILSMRVRVWACIPNLYAFRFAPPIFLPLCLQLPQARPPMRTPRSGNGCIHELSPFFAPRPFLPPRAARINPPTSYAYSVKYRPYEDEEQIKEGWFGTSASSVIGCI